MGTDGKVGTMKQHSSDNGGIDKLPRKRKQEPMMQGIDGRTGSKKKHWSDNGGINKLPDDVLLNILSRLSLKEAGRASVLAHRWRCMWTYVHGTLRFDNKDAMTGNLMDSEKFEFWVNKVVELHQAWCIEGMAICFDAGGDESDLTYSAVDSWVNFAMRKEVQRFEVNLPYKYSDRYEFPSVMRLISLSNGAIVSPFHRLRTLRLDNIEIMDHVVHYFLASCSYLEELCIHFSQVSMNLQVIDPPRLRVLEITGCINLLSLEISAMNLVSLKYGGKEKSLKLKSIPNSCELTISDDFCLSFVMEPEDHRSYSVQLEKLVLDFQLMNTKTFIVAPSELPQLCSLKRLEVQVYAGYSTSLLYVATLLKAAPQLREFRIEMFHSLYPTRMEIDRLPFPIVLALDAKLNFHSKVKVVEIGGYIGCRDDDELVLALMKIGHESIERIVIDTQSDYFDDPLLGVHIAAIQRVRMEIGDSPGMWAATRIEARKVAENLVSKFPSRIKSTIT